MLRNAPLFVFVFVLIALTNIAFRAWRAWKNRKMDAERLRVGLRTEIHQLSFLLDENMKTLADSRPDKRLAVMRGADVFFRAASNRLSVLDADTEAVVRAYSALECTDRIVAAACMPRGPMSLILKDQDKIPDLRGHMERLQSHLKAAALSIEVARQRA